MAVNIFLNAGNHMVLVSFTLVFHHAAETVPQGIEPLGNLHHIFLCIERAVAVRVGSKDFLQRVFPIRKQGERKIENVAGTVYGLEKPVRIRQEQFCDFGKGVLQDIDVKLFKGLCEGVFENCNIKGIAAGIVPGAGKNIIGVCRSARLKAWRASW